MLLNEYGLIKSSSLPVPKIRDDFMTNDRQLEWKSLVKAKISHQGNANNIRHRSRDHGAPSQRCHSIRSYQPLTQRAAFKLYSTFFLDRSYFRRDQAWIFVPSYSEVPVER